MISAIKNFCDNNEYKNGLFLIDMPTGFGKTYSVLEYLYDASKNSDRKIFFITTLKKNLPTDELKERFRSDGRLAEFNEKFLFIDSNADCITENLTSELIKIIPNEIKKTEEYKQLERDVRFIQTKDDEADINTKIIVKRIKEDLRLHNEPAFRYYITNLLKSSFNNVNDRIYAIKADEKWRWLGILYPAVYTRNKQIIFMSIDKFLARNSTLVEPSYMFYNTDIIKDAIIFIDEFDATKDTLLKNIIQNGLQNSIDYLELFKDIHTALQTKVFPTALTASSKKRLESDYGKEQLSTIVAKFKDISETINRDYNLQFSHKTSDDIAAVKRNFLFHDHQFHSILDGGNNFVTTEKDNEAKLNRINFVKSKPTHDSNNIFVMLGKIRGFITYFQGGINILAYNYMECKQENHKDIEDEFTRESAIRTILSEFRLDKRYIDYLTSSILMMTKKKSDIFKSQEYDLSFYEKGFRYYDFENNNAHDMQSQIMMCTMQNTPEKIMLRFCEKAKVVGISATATINSVIGNYDVSYLKAKLQENFHVLSEEDMLRLKNQFLEDTKGYKDISININFIEGRFNYTYSVDAWKAVFDDEELARWAFNEIEQRLEKTKDYAKERYIRVARAYKEFIVHCDIQSFLCLLTKHPRKSDFDLDLDLLIRIFDFIAREHRDLLPPGFKASESVEQLDGEEYDSKKDKIGIRLAKGEKLFVISVYQTVGAGQNIQYTVPKGTKLISTNNYIRKPLQKDFDAIYLDKPTNMLVNLDNGISEEDFTKYLFQIEFLQQKAELSTNDAIILIKNAFKCFSTQRKDGLLFSNKATITKSVLLLETRTIVQAIGRICRTNQKKKNIYIFADERLLDELDVSISDDRLLNPEFRELLKKVYEHQKDSVTSNSSTFENAASLVSVRVNTFINNLIREDWSSARIEQWKALRQLVLKKPTMSAQEIEGNFRGKNFYIELPEQLNFCYFNETQDYANICVFFNSKQYNCKTISAESARLPQLMNISGVRELFEANGWATGFAANNYIMSPPLFNNIYKGALGEIIGKYLFKRYLGIELLEIDDVEEFELFDYKINDNIYVDFKHWKDTTVFDAAEMLRKIEGKLGNTRAKKVLVVNIIADAEANYPINRSVTSNTIIEIPYLCNEKDGRINDEAIMEIRRCINELSN